MLDGGQQAPVENNRKAQQSRSWPSAYERKGNTHAVVLVEGS